MIEYNFCPKCGNKIDKSAKPITCHDCGVKYFNNPKPGAGVLIVSDNQVLLAKRGKGPHIGAYDTVGGFMEIDETPENAAIREAKEETGLDIRLTGLLGVYKDIYGDSGEHTVNIIYTGEILGGSMQAMDDVAALEWIDIKDAPENDGFQSTKDSIRDLKKLYSKS